MLRNFCLAGLFSVCLLLGGKTPAEGNYAATCYSCATTAYSYSYYACASGYNSYSQLAYQNLFYTQQCAYYSAVGYSTYRAYAYNYAYCGYINAYYAHATSPNDPFGFKFQTRQRAYTAYCYAYLAWLN